MTRVVISTSFSDYKIHKKLHVYVTVDQDGMKRLGTENLSFGRNYEKFEVSLAKPIWRHLPKNGPKMPISRPVSNEI